MHTMTFSVITKKLWYFEWFNFWILLGSDHTMTVMIISYINSVLIHTYIKHKNDDAGDTTSVLLCGLIGAITHAMNYTKRQLLHIII